MGIKQLYNDNLRKLTNEYGDGSVMSLSLSLSFQDIIVRLVFATCTQWVAKDPMSLHAGSEDSDQTGLMPRLN